MLDFAGHTPSPRGRRLPHALATALVIVIGVAGAGCAISHHRSTFQGPAVAARRATPVRKPKRLPSPRLPRGGRTVLPGHLVVAYYGVPGTVNILGKTRDPEADARGVERRAAQYAGFGLGVQPAFELVTTVASPYPGPEGTYSAALQGSIVQRYLATAHRHRLLLILDFQPGRGEFLAEVKRYASLLGDPSVGVGLDPEWKLSATAVPDEVLGSSSAASINAVSSYLSHLVARHRLPQKLFIIHEFKTSELPDRQNIAIRPGLATVLQMDGFGAVSDKLNSFRAVTRNAARFHIGFKLFLDPTDDPVLLSARQVMGLRPRPEYISYQ